MGDRVTRENIGVELLKLQLALRGKDLTCLIDDDDWRFNNTLTRNQFYAFKKTSCKLIEKTFKCNTWKRNKIFDQFYEMFGLRIKEELTNLNKDEHE